MDKNIVIVAGDLTNYYLSQKLKSRQLNVTLFGFDHLKKPTRKRGIDWGSFDLVIVPVPFTIDGTTIYAPYANDQTFITDLLLKLNKNAIIIGGPFSINDDRLYDITLNNFFKSKSVTPSCEEIIKIVIEETDFTISGSIISIFGNGTIAKALEPLLIALGADVLLNDNQQIKSSDIIINTGSELKIGKKEIDLSRQNSIIIDVGSKDGGIDYSYAKKVGHKIIKARGLPGRSAPKSVATYIIKSIEHLLE